LSLSVLTTVFPARRAGGFRISDSFSSFSLL